MGADSTNGAVATLPATENEIDQEMMDSVATRLGTSFPKPAATDGQPEAAATADPESEPAAAEGAEPAEAEGDEPATETAAPAEPAAEPPAPDAEPKPGTEYEADTKKLLAARLKDLPEPTRKAVEGVIGARIGQIVAKERTERERMGARVEELTQENEKLAAEKGPRVVSGDVHPTELLESDDAVAQREGKLEEYIAWAEDNADGVNLPDSENYDESKPSYTKEQIRAQARVWRQEKEKLIPLVRENLRARATGDAVLKEVLPALFDAKSEEYRMGQHVLRLMPSIKRYRDYRAIIAQQILGARELTRLLEARKGKAGGKPDEKAKPPVPPLKKAPRAPGGGAQAKGSVVAREHDKPAASSAVSKAYQNPGNRRAFQDAVSAVIGNLS